MYTLLRNMQLVSVIAVVVAVVAWLLNNWQKKHDSKNAIYSKEYNGMVKITGWLGLGLFIVSCIMLTLKMY